MINISFEKKLQIVLEHEAGIGYQSLSQKYQINWHTIENWYLQYKRLGEAGLRRSKSNTHFTRDFKLSVIQYKQYHGLSYRETAKHFQLKCPTSIASWERKYAQEGPDGLSRKIGKANKPGVNPVTQDKDKGNLKHSDIEELARLKEENTYLKAELAYLKKLDALIRKKNQTTEKKHK